METYLDIYESSKSESYKPNWKGKAACLLCATILGSGAYVTEHTKNLEYLSAKEKETVVSTNSKQVPKTDLVKVLEENTAEKVTTIVAPMDSGSLDENVESKKIAVAEVPQSLKPDSVEMSSKDITKAESDKAEVIGGNEIEEIKAEESENTGRNDAEDRNNSEIKEIGTNESDEIENDEVINGMDDVASPFMIDEEGMLYGINTSELDYSTGILELPAEGCIGIRSNALMNFTEGIYEVYIPGNISVIESDVFHGIVDLFDIMVDESNVNYSSIDGVLYGENGTVLLAFPAGRTGGYIVPAQTKRIASGAFYQTGLSVIDIRDCSELEIEDATALQLVR